MEGFVVAEFSLPPGVNRAYDPARTKGRAKIIKNHTAREWSAYAVNKILDQIGNFQCPDKFAILIQLPQGNYDTDHFEKEILDAFKTAGAIKDDKSRYNMQTTIQVVDGLRDRWCRVTLWSLPAGFTKPRINDNPVEEISMAG